MGWGNGLGGEVLTTCVRTQVKIPRTHVDARCSSAGACSPCAAPGTGDADRAVQTL